MTPRPSDRTVPTDRKSLDGVFLLQVHRLGGGIALTAMGSRRLERLTRAHGDDPEFPSARGAHGGTGAIADLSGLARRAATDSIRDLATVGKLTAELTSAHTGAHAERVLDWARDALNAEASEIFLREPGGQDMLLSYFRGDCEFAFSEIGRFHVGQGYPGLVLGDGETIATNDLPGDERYLRERVKSEGFRSYICVPLRGIDGVIGTINIASRSADLEVDRTARILDWAGASVTLVLENTSLRAHLASMTPIVSLGVGGGLEDLSLAMLEKMMRVGNATAGEMRLFRPRLREILHRVTSGPFCEEIRPANCLPCPAITGNLGIVLSGSRDGWPQECRHLTSDADVVQCLPLIVGGEPIGLVQLQYESDGPRPATKHVAVLRSVAVQVASVLRQARDADERSAVTGRDSNDAGREPQRRNRWTGRDTTPENADDGDSVKETRIPRLNIRCFSTFNLARDGRQIPPGSVQRRGAITLLKMLVVNDGHAVTRDFMAEAIWPDVSPEVVANRIHVLIHALRQAIEPPRNGRPRIWTFIRNDGDRYYLNPDAPYRSDVQDFRRLAASGDMLDARGSALEAADSYEAALRLYTGDLLEDEPYAEWCSAEREHLRETALNVAVKLAVHNARRRDFDKSVSFYRRALRIDSLREEIHRGLITTLLAADRRAEAIRQYSVCSETLQRELGVNPLPETRRLVLVDSHRLT